MRDASRPPRTFALATVAVAMALAGAAAQAADCQPRDLPPFGDAAWKHGPLSKLKRDTQYKVESDDGQSVLHATADGSASAWAYLQRTDINATPTLEWRWRVPKLIAGAANEDPK